MAAGRELVGESSRAQVLELWQRAIGMAVMPVQSFDGQWAVVSPGEGGCVVEILVGWGVVQVCMMRMKTVMMGTGVYVHCDVVWMRWQVSGSDDGGGLDGCGGGGDAGQAGIGGLLLQRQQPRQEH